MKEIQSVIVVVLLALFSFVSSSTSIKAQGFMTESGQMSNASNPSNDSPYKTVKRKGRPLLAYDFVHEKRAGLAFCFCSLLFWKTHPIPLREG